MALANLNKEGHEVMDGMDSIVIVNCLSDIPGGRTLNVDGLDTDGGVIKSGHILVREKASGEVKPLNVSGGQYVSLPEGHEYLGVLKATVLKEDPRAAILTAGQVNAAASPYPVTDAIKTALTRIEFLY